MQTTSIQTPFVTGSIHLPSDFEHVSGDFVLKVVMQDSSGIRSKTITKLAMELPYLGFTSIPFALSYPVTKLVNDTNEWYTLRAVITSKKDGRMICFSHRVVRAIDDMGRPRQNVDIDMLAVEENPTLDPTGVECPLGESMELSGVSSEGTPDEADPLSQPATNQVIWV
eukprot:Nitzschia sp. Nitz4//scaffold37_size175936//149757//150263//NITZ4_002064-RA/size175936-processed-gene-0.233-mRNA-1//-1//CDS//3329549842//246//frame0